MKLYTLLEKLKTTLPDREITGVTDDTRKLRKDMVFVCKEILIKSILIMFEDMQSQPCTACGP